MGRHVIRHAGRVATSVVTLHVAPHRERLAASRLWTFEWLFAGVTVDVDLQARWPAKSLVTCWADVPILRLRESRL